VHLGNFTRKLKLKIKYRAIAHRVEGNVATVLRCCRDWFEDQSYWNFPRFTLVMAQFIVQSFIKICYFWLLYFPLISSIQGVIESCTDILTTSYWLHVELGKNI
jgi:hypothetical protein